MTAPGRPPRLPIIFQSYDAPVFFLTICAVNRRQLFDNKSVHASFQQFAEKGYRIRKVSVGRYVLMPDHIHLFVCGTPEFDLSQWVRMLKVAVGKTLLEMGQQPPYCQRGFFDHLIRNSESYAEKWAYVLENPVRAGLVKEAKDWPYQGEVVPIDRV